MPRRSPLLGTLSAEEDFAERSEEIPDEMVAAPPDELLILLADPGPLVAGAKGGWRRQEVPTCAADLWAGRLSGSGVSPLITG